MSEDAREILRELLAEALNGTNGHAVAPQVPPPPVAAVHRPSTWDPPAAGGVERVTLAGDDDLNRFVRDILTRPDRDAILAGRVRFTLGAEAGRVGAAEGSRSGGAGGGRPGGTPSGGDPTRIPRGAVTERAVAAAAKAGGRLVLGPRAVLTPLAREKARALGLQIEREH